tara:strand:+ start:300 stop:740 length:441 start_codon:yes stop_codon:yes gene_type:complete
LSCSIDEWLEEEDCLFYPFVPDLPGRNAWDSFACSFLESANRELNHDVIIFSKITDEGKKNSKRIKFLFSTLKIPAPEIFNRSKDTNVEDFFRKEASLYLSKSQNNSEKYGEVDLFFKDLDVSERLASFIIQNFSLTTRIHDLYSS